MFNKHKSVATFAAPTSDDLFSQFCISVFNLLDLKCVKIVIWIWCNNGWTRQLVVEEIQLKKKV